MVRLGSLLVVLLVLSGCLEQELDVLTVDEVTRLLTADDEKSWTIANETSKLVFDQGITNTYLLTNNLTNDTLNYGEWSLTEDVRSAFTDSLLLQPEQTSASNFLSDILIIAGLTSDQLFLNSDDQKLRFNKIVESD